MANERANILSVKSDVIQVALPFWDGAPETYSTAAIAAAGTSLTVKDNARLSENDFIVFGSVGSQQSEIKRITAAVSAGTALTVAAVTFAHPVGTKITLSRYDQVEIYGSSSASDAAPTLIGSAVSLDVRRGYTEIKASTTYSYYYARYKDSNAGTYSSYSDSAAATGLSSRCRGEIKKDFMSLYNLRYDDLITDDFLNRSLNRWQRALQERRKQWNVLRDQELINTVQDQQGYTLPTDIQDYSTDSIISVKFYNKAPLVYLDQGAFQQMTQDHIGTTVSTAIGVVDVTVVLTDTSDLPSSGSIYVEGDTIAYTGNTESTGTLTGVTGISATHAAGTEVWYVRTSGIPSHYTIDGSKLRVYPMPDSANAGYNLVVDHWRKFTDLVDDSDESLFLYPENALLFLHWQEAIRRRLPYDEQLARERVWLAKVEDIVADDPEFRDVWLTPKQGEIYTNYY